MSKTDIPGEAPPSFASVLSPAQHRAIGAMLFNHVWMLLERSARTPDDDAEMIHAAHASLMHWSVAGEPVNLVRGEWQCSRVYATLERSHAAVFHASRCLSLCERHGIGGFDLAASHEAMARALAASGDVTGAASHTASARRIAQQLDDAQDRSVIEQDLGTLPGPKPMQPPGSIAMA